MIHCDFRFPSFLFRDARTGLALVADFLYSSNCGAVSMNAKLPALLGYMVGLSSGCPTIMLGPEKSALISFIKLSESLSETNKETKSAFAYYHTGSTTVVVMHDFSGRVLTVDWMRWQHTFERMQCSGRHRLRPRGGGRGGQIESWLLLLKTLLC